MSKQEHLRLVEVGNQVLDEAPQVFIDGDVEADGKPGYGSLLSIGSIAPHGETFYIELAPDSDLFIPSQKEFCEAHDLERDRLLTEGVNPITAIKKYFEWVDMISEKYNKSPVFSGFNIGFDFGFIDLYGAKAGIKNPYGIAPFDLKSRVLGLNGNWDWSQTSKNNLPSIFLPEGDFTHNALEDSAYQQQIHFAVAGFIVEQGL